jgi:hypothetical protein
MMTTHQYFLPLVNGEKELGNESLVISHWSLVIGHWSLVIGHWSLVISHWSLVIGHLSLVIGHWSLVIGHLSFVTRKLPFSPPCSLLPAPLPLSPHSLLPTLQPHRALLLMLQIRLKQRLWQITTKML